MRRLEEMSAKVLDAASSSVRLSILKLLSSRGRLPYTELMFAVNLDPVRDAGKFVYHLKSLMDAGLIRIDRKGKKYSLTELGENVVRFSRDLEEYLAVKKGKLFVRTSKLSIEEFDRSKIANSLVIEAGVPLELARDIAAEAEDRLINLKTRHLTAPLIREFINALLLERGFEEYRHRLTRLGMPVYDVTQVIETTGRNGSPISSVEMAASSSVLREYVLLKGVSREVADAHLSGLIHLDATESWLLKPDFASHDLRTFFNLTEIQKKIPEDLEEALNIVERIYRYSSNEVSGGIAMPFLNTILAPFALGVDMKRLEKLVKRFLEDINGEASHNPHTPRLSIGVTLKVPREIEDEPAINPGGRDLSYKDFHEGASLLAKVLLKQAYIISSKTPLLNPMLTIKLNNIDEESTGTISNLEVTHGSIYLDFTGDVEAVYFGDGVSLNNRWTGDWRVDIIRTGQAGTVFLNLARITLQSRGNFERFRKLADDAIQLAVEALKQKRETLTEKMSVDLLPMLKGLNFSIKDAQYGIGILGLSEAASIQVGSTIGAQDKALEFAVKTLKYLHGEASNLSKELDMRINLLQKPCEKGGPRLAKLDLESFGKNTLKFQGLTSNPYYTDIPLIPSNLDISMEDRAKIEGKLQQYLNGGHIHLLHIYNAEPQALWKFTSRLRTMDIRHAAYSIELSHCRACFALTPSILQVCPRCGSSSILHYGVASALLKPLKFWPSAKVKDREEWIRYSIN